MLDMERLDQNSFNAQGECPACGSSNLDYGAVEVDWDTASYDWTCCDCGSQWIEWYWLEFYSQMLTFDWTKKMSTEDERREREEI